jgi:hypothetical protein
LIQKGTLTYDTKYYSYYLEIRWKMP